MIQGVQENMSHSQSQEASPVTFNDKYLLLKFAGYMEHHWGTFPQILWRKSKLAKKWMKLGGNVPPTMLHIFCKFGQKILITLYQFLNDQNLSPEPVFFPTRQFFTQGKNAGVN